MIDAGWLASLVIAAGAEIAIADGPDEVDRGPAAWAADATGAAAEATFGPFPAPVTFDTAQVISADQVVVTVDIGRDAIPTGGSHVQRILIGFADG